MRFRPRALALCVGITMLGSVVAGPQVRALATSSGGATPSASGQPRVTVSDVSVLEGDKGTRNAVFAISLSSPPAAGTGVSVPYSTADNDATGVKSAAVAG